MKITYDKEADALYIRLLEGDHECRVMRLTDDVALDFAGEERLVGIEVLGPVACSRSPSHRASSSSISFPPARRPESAIREGVRRVLEVHTAFPDRGFDPGKL